MTLKISEKDLYASFHITSPSFAVLFFTSTGWKGKMDQSEGTADFSRFSIVTIIQIYSFDDAKTLQHSLLGTFMTFQPVNVRYC